MVTNSSKSNSSFTFFILIVLLLATGCAGDPGSINTLKALEPEVSLKNFPNLMLTSDSKEGVPISKQIRDRIMYSILGKLRQSPQNPYEEISYIDNSHSISSQIKPDSLLANVTFTNYEEGSDIARFMLAGLGQIHIDGHLKLTSGNDDKTLAVHEITKTFAWGGMYGALTKIEDIEEGFAEAVVEALLNKKGGSKDSE